MNQILRANSSNSNHEYVYLSETSNRMVSAVVVNDADAAYSQTLHFESINIKEARQKYGFPNENPLVGNIHWEWVLNDGRHILYEEEVTDGVGLKSVQNVQGLGTDAAKIHYVSGDVEAWGQQSYLQSLNHIVGQQDVDWIRSSFEDVETSVEDVFTNECTMVIIEGGDFFTSPMLAFINSNWEHIDQWMSEGRLLVVNAATNESLGRVEIGSSGIYSEQIYTNSMQAYVDPLIYDPPYYVHPMLTTDEFPAYFSGDYYGNFVAHNVITGDYTSSVFTCSGGNTLVEKEWGAGLLIVGGLTLPWFVTVSTWQPQPQMSNFLYSLLEWGRDVANNFFNVIFHNAVDYTASSTENSTAYWMLVAEGETSPTETELLNQNLYGGSIIQSGNYELIAGEELQVVIENLIPATSYTIYFIYEFENGTISEVSLNSFTTDKDTDGDDIGDNLDDDDDNDGLPDAEEIIVGSDPLEPDSDGDGLLDGEEVESGNDPVDTDSDDDGIIDFDDDVLNRRPYLVNNMSSEVETGRRLIISNDLLKAIDDDNGDDELIYTISELPEHGYLILNNQMFKKDSDFFTIDDLENSTFYYYCPFDVQVSSVSFTFSVFDGIDGVLPDEIFTINISEVNGVPVVYNHNVENGEVSGVMPNQYIGVDEMLWTIDFERAGYSFSEWNTEPDGTGERYGDGAIIQQISTPLSLYAVWNEIVYDIIYRNTEGFSHGNTEVYRISDELIHLNPLPNMRDQIFGGWYTYDGINVDTVAVPAIKKGSIGDRKFYAKWMDQRDEKVALMIVEHQGEGATEPMLGETAILCHNVQQFSASSSEGWNFDHWVINGETYLTETLELIVETDLFAKAYFTPDTLLMNISGNGLGALVPNEGTHTVYQGDVVELNATSTTNSIFEQWLVNGVAYNSENISITVDGNMDVEAVFSRLPFSLSVDMQGLGSIVPEIGEQEIYWGDSLHFDAVENPFWKFDHWEINGKKYINSMIDLFVDADVEAKCYFARQAHKIDVYAVGHGKVSPEIEGKAMYHSDTLYLEAFPEPGWDLIKWLVNDLEYYGDELMIQITENTVVTAIFQEVTAELQMAQVGKGECSPNENNVYSLGSTVDLEATPSDGWLFEKWLINGIENFEVSTSIIMTEDVEVTAYFVEFIPELEMNQVGEGSISPEIGIYEYDYATQVTLSATPADGWLLKMWVIDEVEVYEDAPVIEMTKDILATACFIEKTYSITYRANGGLGTMETQSGLLGEVAISDCLYERENCLFIGWALMPDGEVEYKAGELLVIESDLTLYAVWEVLTASDGVEQGTFDVYPNPTNKLLNIKSNQFIEQVVIYSIIGQQVEEYSVLGHSLIIDMSDLPNGQYLLKILSEDQNFEIVKVSKR